MDVFTLQAPPVATSSDFKKIPEKIAQINPSPVNRPRIFFSTLYPP